VPQGPSRGPSYHVPKRTSSYRDALFETDEYRSVQERIRANVKRIREERGWTQQEAAERCERMSYQHFSQVESGKTNLTLVTLCRVARGLGVDIVDLVVPMRTRLRGRADDRPARR